MKRKFTKYPQSIMANSYTYGGQEFSYPQMIEIQKGLDSGVDVSLYAKPELTSSRMFYIRRGLEQGLDVSTFFDPELSVADLDRIVNAHIYEESAAFNSIPQPFNPTSKKIIDGIASGLNVSTEVAKYLADFYEEDGGPEVVEIDNEEEYIDFIVDVAKERFEEILLNEGPDGVIEYEGEAGAKKFFEVARALGIDPEDFRL